VEADRRQGSLDLVELVTLLEERERQPASAATSARVWGFPEA
jgi:hypothetical protein